jgi:hypothetical protein
VKDPDAIARELLHTVVEAEKAQARADRLLLKVDALGRELAPYMPADVLTLAYCDHLNEEVVVQISRLQDGDVLAERIDTTRISHVEWLAPNDPAPTQADLDLAADCSSHTVNPTVDALAVALIDEEVH